MTDRSETPPIADAIQSTAKRAMAVQSEFSEKLIEANQHWFEQIQIESNEAWELFRKFNSTASVAEKITALQDWTKGVTARTAQDATYAIEIARSLGFIELNLFGRRTGGADRAAQEAA
ncbi:hypothetical protein JQ559_20240 [Bradyrhizobium viridifuturi]|uniref:hypothetical protein n=1 Tax=Pseudomonadota TaxID=1224 RepID=UPI000396BFF2|nr:hypothetical protein [Bradyrhizobium viridifuturi]ERF82312.1 MAG: hypothetical protein C207_04449 [Bradyrhizobium sp. DFCI-1]KTS81252.1 hypothetical protein RSA31_22530 [Pantoea dispersa]MCA3795563.1 hypothetical protein [Burkholderia sp.]OYU60988.1 MAG: hypothetical protein CFE30_17965 [Bradyrhizobium sp. PARBB1]PSO22686.1 hypothetical protein C7G43_26315 [Bradyrhizobium sp. MOS004]QRI68788.1 hypothetical protein JQ507_28440 [Bradyrhizobium sp. PSBB068]HAQ80075.1 hypothetical protein [Br